MLASQHQPAWASKSPSNPSSPAMFPPQQIAGLFVKRIFKQTTTVGVYQIFILENTRNPWGAPKIRWHDAIPMEENEVSESSDTQTGGDLVEARV